MIDTALQDFRFGFRMLRRSPGFSMLAILCLTLGIGANVAVFSWIEGILIRPFPAVAHQERLLAVSGTARGTDGSSDVSWPDFLDFQRSCRLIHLIEDKITGATLSIGDRAERASGSIVSADYFDALGIRPVLGRGFAPDEGSGRNAHPVTVISYRAWKQRCEIAGCRRREVDRKTRQQCIEQGILVGPQPVALAAAEKGAVARRRKIIVVRHRHRIGNRTR